MTIWYGMQILSQNQTKRGFRWEGGIFGAIPKEPFFGAYHGVENNCLEFLIDQILGYTFFARGLPQPVVCYIK